MKTTFKVSDFKKVLTQLSNVVKPNNAIPILGYVQLISTSSGVVIQGTDHQVYYSISLPSEEGAEEGEILLEAMETKAMLARLDATSEVSFSTTAKEVFIKSGTSTWRRALRTSVDMPTFPTLEEDMFQELPAGRLIQLLTAAMQATPKKQTFNPGITQLYIHDGTISSGDGLWFQRVVCPELAHVTTTIPIAGTKTLLAVLGGWGDVPVQFGYTDNHVIVRNNNEILGISRMSLEFPDISTYLDNPKITHTDNLTVLSKEFVTALQQVALSAPSETGMITLHLDNHAKMKLSAKTLAGSAEAYVSCSWEGSPRTVHVDGQALRGVISACGKPEKFTISLGPDERRNPSTLYITHEGVSAAIVQQRAIR